MNDTITNLNDELTIEEVFAAYFDCRRMKRNTINQLRFEVNLETNLVRLYDDLVSGNYKIGQSIAFVVKHPKIREVWAADFRDRVVHHILYNRLSPHYYRRFIRDSYACIPGRGTHDGMRRVVGFARSITRNWTRPAYFLKIDIANFFNAIDRHELLRILNYNSHLNPYWVHDLTRQVVLHDPRENAFLKSSRRLFNQVPAHKSLRLAPPGKGLPIGNLTSQFFANVYLNELDQYVKHKLKGHYYGRYVDDMVLLHEDPAQLNEWRLAIDDFLYKRLELRLHPNKTHLNRAHTGIDFIGFIIKPWRVYLRQTSLSRCKQKIHRWHKNGAHVDDHETLDNLANSVNSYLGMLRQVDGYRARRAICEKINNLFIHSDADYTKINIR